MVAGTLTYNTKMDTKGLQEGANKFGTSIKNIVAGLGIDRIISGAFNMINSSLDGAISRLDTLNNFPKVMSNLGIDAQSSQKAIDDLSERIKGIPTTLDDAAMAVERFTSKNGDVQESVEIFDAVNNAILAGGASADIQKSALEQLSQAYSKGKPDMMEWRTMQMAMPAQLKQVAQAMGMTTDELGEGLRESKVSMDDFIGTMIRLNKEGVNGFQSFEQQAKNSTGGIKTAITNAKTAVTRGVANIVDSIDKGLKDAGLGGIAQVISNVGKKFESVLKWMAQKAKEIIPPLIQEVRKVYNTIKNVLQKIYPIFEPLIKKLGNLKPLISAVIKGFLTFKSITTVISILNAVKSAFVGLYATMMANPFAFVAGAITAIIIAYNTMIKKNKEISESEKIFNSKMQEINGTLDKYKEKMKQLEDQKQEFLDKNIGELEYYQDLAEELKSIVDENGRVKEGYEERANFIVTTLKDALGLEIDYTDGVIDGYKDLEQKIYDVIDAKRAQYLVESNEEKYNEAKNQRVKLEENYAEALDTNKQKQEEFNAKAGELAEKLGISADELKRWKDETKNFTYADLEIGLKKLGVNLSHTSKDARDLASDFVLVSAQFDQTSNTLRDSSNAFTDNEKIINDYESALISLKDGNYDAVKSIYEDTHNFQGATSEETYNNYQKAIDMYKNYRKELDENKDGYDEDYIKKEKERVDNVLKTLEEGQAQYKASVQEGLEDVNLVWNDNLDEQLSKITGYNIEFKDAGNGQVQAYVDGIATGEPKSKEEMAQLVSNTINEAAKQETNSEEAGKNFIRGFNNGEGNPYLQQAGQNVASKFGEKILNSLKNKLGIASPSKKTKQMGEFLDLGLIQGIESKRQAVMSAVKGLGDDVLDQMSNAVNVESGKINAQAILSSNVSRTIQINASFIGDVELDNRRVGKIIAPDVSRAIKAGGL